MAKILLRQRNAQVYEKEKKRKENQGPQYSNYEKVEKCGDYKKK